jgi:hypothetical protein
MVRTRFPVAYEFQNQLHRDAKFASGAVSQALVWRRFFFPPRERRPFLVAVQSKADVTESATESQRSSDTRAASSSLELKVSVIQKCPPEYIRASPTMLPS